MSKEHLQLCCKGTDIQHFKLDPHETNQKNKFGNGIFPLASSYTTNFLNTIVALKQVDHSPCKPQGHIEKSFSR
jgi:hypothetical protein